MAAYAIKAPPIDPLAERLTFTATKTMYGGRQIAAGDPIFLFDGAAGLYARGRVLAAEAVRPEPGRDRQTPRVTMTIAVTARARRALSRRELRPFDQWGDGRPETELNFKYYRQATDKIVGLSDATAAFLDRFFD